MLGWHRDIGGKGQNRKRGKGGGHGKDSGLEHRQRGKTNKDGHYKKRRDVERVDDLK